MKKIINENERGFLFKNGKFVKVLGAGKYHTFGSNTIEVVSLEDSITSQNCSLDVLLLNEDMKKQITQAEVEDGELALHFVNGKFVDVLEPGTYAYWSVYDKHEFKIIDTSEAEVSADVPRYLFDKIPGRFLSAVRVAQFEKACLYYDHKFVKLLEPGTYYFWKNNVVVSIDRIDTRLTQMDIIGQEILTQDKVTLRINCICNYRITDYVKINTEIDNYKEQIHVTAQLALREYVGRYRLDEILESREKISAYISEQLRAKAKEFYVEIIDAGVKDIILPGEIREIMNTVLVAEKRAQASVITRREEVASTRSLLNTAKLMDENQTLYKLKELEYLEKICENVGNITVSGNGDLLSQLANVIGGRTAS